MAYSTSKLIIIKRTALVAGALAMLLGACKGDGMRPVDAAADAPQAGATSTGTGGPNGTGTVATTGQGTASGTGTLSSTATATSPGSPDTTGTATATATSTGTASTSSTVVTSTGTSTGTATGTGEPWTEVPGNDSAGVDASAGLDVRAGDTAKDSTVFPVEPMTRPCDLYADANTPCVAAYSMIRTLSKSYTGPLFQVRAGSSSTNLTMSGGTTKDIMPGPDGYVDVSTVDAACGTGYCTVSLLYDHSGNSNHLKRAPKGNSKGGAAVPQDDYEAIATKGRVMAGGHEVYSLYMNKLEGYRTAVGVVGKNMPTGSKPQGIYMLADGTRKATGCCWEFGNVTTNPATEWAFVDALCLNSGSFSIVGAGAGTGAGSGPWFRADFGELWAGGNSMGGNGSPRTPLYISADPIPLNNVKNPSLDGVRFALGFLKASTSEYAIRVADVLSASADQPVTAWKGGMPETLGHKGGIVLGVGSDNANNSWGTFYEGAIVAGYPSDDVELSVMKNIKSVGYAPAP